MRWSSPCPAASLIEPKPVATSGVSGRDWTELDASTRCHRHLAGRRVSASDTFDGALAQHAKADEPIPHLAACLVDAVFGAVHQGYFDEARFLAAISLVQSIGSSGPDWHGRREGRL